MIIFNRLWKTMKEKNISQYMLIQNHKISESQLTRLRKNEVVKTEILSKLCTILNCKIEDICEYVEDDDEIKICDALNCDINDIIEYKKD